MVAVDFGALVGIASGASAHARTAKAKCTKQPFVGTVDRTAESPSGTGQPAASRETAEFDAAVVYDFGNRKNYTVYVGDYDVDPDDLGGTLTAPPGNVLVTIFLRSASGKALKAGTTLTPGKDPVSVIIDAGAGARRGPGAHRGRARRTSPRRGSHGRRRGGRQGITALTVSSTVWKSSA